MTSSAKILENRRETVKKEAHIYCNSDFLRTFAVHFGQWNKKSGAGRREPRSPQNGVN